MDHVRLPVDKSYDSGARGNQKRTVIVFRQTLDPVVLELQRIEPGRTRSPSPQPGQRPHPEIAPAVFVKANCACTRTAILTVTLHAALLNRAQRPRGGEPGRPNRAFTILEEPADETFCQRLAVSELPSFPACETS